VKPAAAAAAAAAMIATPVVAAAAAAAATVAVAAAVAVAVAAATTIGRKTNLKRKNKLYTIITVNITFTMRRMMRMHDMCVFALYAASLTIHMFLYNICFVLMITIKNSNYFFKTKLNYYEKSVLLRRTCRRVSAGNLLRC